MKILFYVRATSPSFFDFKTNKTVGHSAYIRFISRGLNLPIVKENNSLIFINKNQTILIHLLKCVQTEESVWLPNFACKCNKFSNF
jgi:hypothetical protein